MPDCLAEGPVFGPGPTPPETHLVYFVHDLGDPAVARRLSMLRPYLVSAVIIGFHRTAPAPLRVAGWPAVTLGCTIDGRLGRRAFSVLRNLAMIRRLRRHLLGANFVMARQLEMLALATAARHRYAKTAILAYECLDIHSVMVGPSPISRALRLAEVRLLRATDVVIVSSPAFIQAYLRPTHGVMLPPTCLIENKVLRGELDGWPKNQPRPPGPPWRIGWYGVLRCRRSLELLIELTRQLPGQVVVELRGRPARSAIPDFDSLVAAAPDVSFLGAYDRQHDLGRIYQAVHFAWAIDFYETGLNSTWLLPNRLYEGGLHGAVPIAAASVETGHWLARQNAGTLLQEPFAAELLRYFSSLNTETYAAAVASLAAVPVECWADDGQDGERLMASVSRRR
jgi:succinoglycan biosynthesis protein ExoL